jgi:hypothetical protein
MEKFLTAEFGTTKTQVGTEQNDRKGVLQKWTSAFAF